MRFSGISGGAIFHTGSMSLATCTFIENEAGDEGLAVISIGLLDSMDNVTFQDNTKHCATGQYGYMNKVIFRSPSCPMFGWQDRAFRMFALLLYYT